MTGYIDAVRTTGARALFKISSVTAVVESKEDGVGCVVYAGTVGQFIRDDYQDFIDRLEKGLNKP